MMIALSAGGVLLMIALAVGSHRAFGANLRTMDAHLAGPMKPFYRAVAWSYVWQALRIVGAAGAGLAAGFLVAAVVIWR